MGLKQKISISLFALFALFIVWFCCTDPVKPDFIVPTIGNNSQIQTFGTMWVDSTFGMYISAEGTSPLTFEWQKNRAPLYYSRVGAIYDTLKFSPLTEADSGTYRCIVINNLGSDTSKEFELKPYSDTIKPEITLLSPQDGLITEDSILNITFKVIDEKGISSVKVNGTVVTSTDSVYNHTLKLKLGLNKDTIIAIDASTKKNSDTLLMTFTYDPTFADTIQPEITLISPANGSTTDDSLLNIKFKVTDKSGISSVKVNGVSVTSTDSVYNHALKLKLGQNKDTIIAIDASTRKNSDTLLMTFTYDPTFTDTIQPVITLISPQNGSTTGDSLLNIKFTVTDKSGISSVKVNGTSVVSTDSVYNHTLKLKQGQNKDTIIAIDASTKKNSDTLLMTFTYDPTFTDTIQPQITLNSPQNGMTTGDSLLNIKFTVTDKSGISSVKVNGTAVTSADSVYNHTLKLKLGLNKDTIIAVDASTKKNSDTLLMTFTYDPTFGDTIGPVIKLLSPQNNAVSSDSSLRITFKVTDPSGISKVMVKTKTVTSSDTIYTDTLKLVLGANPVAIIATDNATAKKNSDTLDLTFTYDPTYTDTLGPDITFISPVNGAHLKTSPVDVSVNVNDQSGVAWVTINGDTATLSGNNYIKSRSLSLGKNTLKAKAQDKSTKKNLDSSSISVTYDNIKPSLKTVDPGINNSSINADSIVLQVVAKDNIGIKEVKFSVGVTPYTTGVFEDSIFYAKIKSLSPNVFTTIKVNAADSATNDSTINVLVKYDPSLNDLLPPVINQLSGPTDNARVKTAQNTFSFDITDANGLDSVYYTDNDVFQANLTNISGSQYECTRNFGTSYGLHTIRIYAIDNSANHNQQIKVIRVTFNTGISAVTNTSPANGAADIAAQTQFTWSGGDDPDADPVTFKLYYGTASNSLTGVFDAGTNKTVQASPSLTGNTRYYWKVTAYSAAYPVDSISSAITNYTTFNQPPTISLTAPANAATKQAQNATLQYSASDPENNPVTYSIYLGRAASLTEDSILISGISTNSHQLTSLLNGAQYFWKVKAAEAAGFPAKSCTSSVRSFYTVNKLQWTSQTYNYSSYKNETIRIKLTPLVDYSSGHTIQFSILSGPSASISNDTLMWKRISTDGSTKTISVITEDSWAQDPKKDTADFVIAERALPVGMVFIPAKNQKFVMGKTGYTNAEPEHNVSFRWDFFMGQKEVTQSEYSTVMSRYAGYTNPDWSSNGSGPNNPAYYMTWYDAVLYCNALSIRDGYDPVFSYTSITGTPGNGCSNLLNFAVDTSKNGYRLPTESEWEFACRGGTTTLCFFGDDTTIGHVTGYAWCDENTDTTKPVGSLLANPYGLLDINGNVKEWCHDDAAQLYPSEDQVDPLGPSTRFSYTRCRGGSYADMAQYQSSVHRFSAEPGYQFWAVDIGIRVVRRINY